MSAESRAFARLEQLLEALNQLLEPGSTERAALVSRLLETTSLSPAGVEWALEHCLESRPSRAELELLVSSVRPAPRAHIILPASVFVAAHRCLALGLAASARVFVKPSRREPTLIEALHARAPGLFELVERLQPEPADHVFAYGSDTTLEALRRELPEGTVLHAHGSGFGVAVVDLEAAPVADGGSAEPDPSRAAARAIAQDTACFDQRGCLSPRFVLALGEPASSVRFAAVLAAELGAVERSLPLGRLDESERAEATWYRQCAACFGDVLPAGTGAVSVRDAAEPGRLVGEGMTALDVPPAGRHLEVIAVRHLEPALETLRPWLTTVGCSSAALEASLRPWLHPIRVTALGRMQRPPFDGPVDRRADPRGEVIRRTSPPSRQR